MHDYELKSSQFRREREASWLELESLLAKIDRGGLRGLTHDELSRLPTLYRGAVSSLSVARAVSLDKNLLAFLTNLVARAYVAVYSSKTRPSTAVREFLARGLPASVRLFRWYLAAAVVCLGLGIVTGYAMTAADVERYGPAQKAARTEPQSALHADDSQS